MWFGWWLMQAEQFIRSPTKRRRLFTPHLQEALSVGDEDVPVVWIDVIRTSPLESGESGL